MPYSLIPRSLILLKPVKRFMPSVHWLSLRQVALSVFLSIALLGWMTLGQPALALSEQPLSDQPKGESPIEQSELSQPLDLAAFKSDIEQVKAKGKIRIALVNKDNPPFFSKSPDGKLVGIDVDLGQAIADSLQVPAEFVQTAKTFDDVIESVHRGDVDLAISKLARSLPRAQKVLFSKPYLNFRQALLVNRLALAQEKAKGLNTDQVVQDLRGKVGVYAGSAYVQYARKAFPKAEIVEFEKWPDAIDAVIKGKVMALFRDELEVRSIVLNKPELAIQLRTVVLTDSSDTKGIAASAGKHFLMDYTNLFIDTQYQQRNADQLLNLPTNKQDSINK